MPNSIIDGVIWDDTPYDINDKRITNSNITDWTSKYTKPSTGIPESDLDNSLKSKISRKAGTLTLSTSWTDEQNGIFTQSVAITGTDANSKVNLQPDSTVIIAMATDKVQALYIENTDGVLTAVAVGAAPTRQLTIQYDIEEVQVVIP